MFRQYHPLTQREPAQNAAWQSLQQELATDDTINRRYLGIYIYKDTEVPGGIPRIIDDESFAKAQEVMAKNKKAPARAKAIEDNYLLTTKLAARR